MMIYNIMLATTLALALAAASVPAQADSYRETLIEFQTGYDRDGR